MSKSALFPLGMRLFPFFSKPGPGAVASKVHEVVSPEEADRRRLREQHGVHLISEAEEGLPAAETSRGSYGWTNSPATKAVPLFRKRVFRAFEVHNLAVGGVQCVGYLKLQEAQAVEAGNNTVWVRLYPEPYEEACCLVSIPLLRVGKMKGPSRNDGNWVDFEVFADK